MKYFYELYLVVQNHPQPGDGLTLPENCQQMIHDLREEIIFYIFWGHQKLLIDKCKNDRE